MYPINGPIETFTGLLIFEVSGREYCLNYSDVTATLRPPFKRIHNSRQNKQMDSALSVGDHSVPLMNLTQLLKRKGSGRSEKKDSRVIIIEKNNESLALLVEKVIEVIALDTKFITTSLKFNPKMEFSDKNVGRKFVEGTLEFEGRNLQLLNIDEIIKTVKN